MPKTTIPRKLLVSARKDLTAALTTRGVTATTVRLTQRGAGVYATALINGKRCETFLPRGVVAWDVIAKQLIAHAEQQDGVTRVM